MPNGQIDIDVLDVFVIDGDGTLHSRVAQPPDSADVRAAGRAALEQLQSVKAAPGYRLGSERGTVVRSGTGEEVSHSVLLSSEHVRGRLRDAILIDLPGLRVDLSSRRDVGAAMQWACRVDGGPLVGRRRATLLVRPTPADNVTMIDLVPARRHRVGAAAFVRIGVEAATELARRLRAA